MARIVIAGRSAQSREQMASLLSSSGYPVYRLCSSAGELRRVLNDCDDGLLILAGQLPDCSADELFWDYGSQVQILLIARPPVLEACEEAGVFRLALPTSQQAVLGAVEMLTQLHRMRLPRRSADEKQLVEEAKALLMRRDGLTEPQAHRMLQQAAMSRGLRMADCAAQIIKGDGG
ncbi:MAG: ANTAR domain-containing protein [Oscillospiraceae bacterium]|nr:ANTAR domain-containing protein [Oscillospiraceae bacterium]MBR6954198.1 ANTAR domain-containing protein [Clostridia bacterium]